MASYKQLSDKDLSSVTGGYIHPDIHIDIKSNDLLAFVCGFFDGWNKKPYQGGC